MVHTLGALEGAVDVLAVGHTGHESADTLRIAGPGHAHLEALQQRVAVEQVQHLQ